MSGRDAKSIDATLEAETVCLKLASGPRTMRVFQEN